MTLAADVEAVLPLLRAEAEALMVDTCQITKPGAGEPEFDNDTGQYTDPEPVVVYEGKCRLQIRSRVDNETGAGDREVITQEPELQLPISGTDSVSVGHVATILTAAHDSSLVGRTYTVAGRFEKTHATARRLQVVEVVG